VNSLYKPPVLFLVFNRPVPTSQVFEAIRAACPDKLYVAADGPRSNRPGEAESCAQVRSLVDRVDWPCEVKTLFREQNVGCRRAVSEAITWFFENEEEGVILEDDCLPSPDFFRFCGEALHTYRDEHRVMHVGGHVLLEAPDKEDLFFSRLVPIWGWATWRRAWNAYDTDMSRNDELDQLPLKKWYGSQASNVRKAIRRIHDDKVDAWGARWALSVLVNDGLSVVPRSNLISNVGFGKDATHTKVDSHLANRPFGELGTVLTRKADLSSDPAYDEAYLRIMNRKSNIGKRLVNKLQELIVRS
jgi:hypothetical protein